MNPNSSGHKTVVQRCYSACHLLVPNEVGDWDFKIFGFYITLANAGHYFQNNVVILDGRKHVDKTRQFPPKSENGKAEGERGGEEKAKFAGKRAWRQQNLD